MSGEFRGNAWVGYFDIYGFKALVAEQRNDLGGLAQKLQDTYDEVSKVLLPDTAIFRISDCFFITCPQTQDDPLNSLLSVQRQVEELLRVYSERELPLRGGLAFGEVYAKGDVLIGSAVAKAYEYEQLVPCPVVVIPAREIRESKIPLTKWKASEDIATRDGIIAATLWKPRPIQDFYNLTVRMYRKYRVGGPASVAKAWYDAQRFIKTEFGL